MPLLTTVPRRPVVEAAVCALAATLLLPAPATGAPAGLGDRELSLTFEGPTARAALTNRGTTAMGVDRVHNEHGNVMTVRRGRGSALRFPAYAEEDPGLAALRVVAGAEDDPLSPGTADFRIGVDFRLNAVSQGSAVDNGNNLVQRGLYDDVAQYKLQVDGRRVSCRVKGASGTVEVSGARVATGRWFRVACTRRERAVTLRLVRLDTGRVRQWRASGRTGDVSAEEATVPLSVGAKLYADGSLVDSDSDQFNGRLDNAFLNVAS